VALVALVGGAAVAAGVLLDQLWLAFVGTAALGAAPFGLLVPALGDTGENAYRDQNFIGGMLTVFGVSPTEQDAARSEAVRTTPSFLL
jgi:hypothetical protein